MKGRSLENTPKNASRYHKSIGELLSSPLFGSYLIKQEYPVSSINPDYYSNRERIDYVILTLNVAIEIQGECHDQPIRFGGHDKDTTKRKFRNGLNRDYSKKQAIEDAGWAYIDIHHSEIKSLTVEKLISRITQAMIVNNIQGKRDNVVPKPKKPKRKYNWPKKKLQSRGFPKKEK